MCILSAAQGLNITLLTVISEGFIGYIVVLDFHFTLSTFYVVGS